MSRNINLIINFRFPQNVIPLLMHMYDALKLQLSAVNNLFLNNVIMKTELNN